MPDIFDIINNYSHYGSDSNASSEDNEKQYSSMTVIVNHARVNLINDSVKTHEYVMDYNMLMQGYMANKDKLLFTVLRTPMYQYPSTELSYELFVDTDIDESIYWRMYEEVYTEINDSIEYRGYSKPMIVWDTPESDKQMEFLYIDEIYDTDSGKKLSNTQMIRCIVDKLDGNYYDLDDSDVSDDELDNANTIIVDTYKSNGLGGSNKFDKTNKPNNPEWYVKHVKETNLNNRLDKIDNKIKMLERTTRGGDLIVLMVVLFGVVNMAAILFHS
jgi:hypothetical protein